MKAEILISAAIMLCAFTIPMICTTSPPAFVASAAQEDTIATIVQPRPAIEEPAINAVSTADGIKKQPDCDVVIDSMKDKSSNIDEDMSEIKKDLQELKKRKKRKKITKKKIKKKKVVDK